MPFASGARPSAILSPKLEALRAVRLALHDELATYQRAPNTAPEHVVNCRAYYLALSAVCDQTYRHIQSEAGLAPRLLPHSVYRYSLGQMHANNDSNAIQMSRDVFDTVDAHLQTIAAQGLVGEPSVAEALATDASLGRVAPHSDSAGTAGIFMQVCGDGEPASAMQRSINRTVSKKYMEWAQDDELANVEISDAQTLAIAQAFQLANADVQNRIIHPVVFGAICRALKQALRERAGERIPATVHRNDQMSVLQVAATERQPLLRTAFGNAAGLGTLMHDDDALRFLVAESTGTGYDKAMLSRMLLRSIFSGDDTRARRPRNTTRTSTGHVVDIIAG